MLAIEEADVILFMVDIKEGITGMDEDLCVMLRRAKKPVFVVANKADNYKLLDDIHDFHRLGFEKLYGISAMNGSGTGELLDEVALNCMENQQHQP
jgi:GTP-binding protein